MKPMPYVYMGGGYWRLADVPKGEKAEILHGDEALERARWELVGEFLAEQEAEKDTMNGPT